MVKLFIVKTSSYSFEFGSFQTEAEWQKENFKIESLKKMILALLQKGKRSSWPQMSIKR